MKILERTILPAITRYINPGKAALIFGPRRVGKTVLLKQIVASEPGKSLLLSGEDERTQTLLEEKSVANYKRLFSGLNLLAIDEAQHIPDIGWKLKFIVDEMPEIKVLATGSSSFDLLNTAGEPLVGRSRQFLLLPFSVKEISRAETTFEMQQNLDDRLIYGCYPEVYSIEDSQEKEEYLRDIVTSYLLKDILMIDGVKNSAKMRQLLRLLSYQAGQEVSIEELGRQVAMNKVTVDKYLDLLEKVYVIRRLPTFAKNLRNEVSRKSKWIFLDNGIRNSLIGDFRPLALRDDVGILWENYMISERLKQNNNNRIFNDMFFWRTYTQKEIDLVELTETSQIHAFEFKFGNKKPPIPTDFNKAYPDADFSVINPSNYITDFLEM